MHPYLWRRVHCNILARRWKVLGYIQLRARNAELWDHGGMSTPEERPRAKSLHPLLALVPFLRPDGDDGRGFALLTPPALSWPCRYAAAAHDPASGRRRHDQSLVLALSPRRRFGAFAALRFFLVPGGGSAVMPTRTACIGAWCVWIRYFTRLAWAKPSRLTADTAVRPSRRQFVHRTALH